MSLWRERQAASARRRPTRPAGATEILRPQFGDQRSGGSGGPLSAAVVHEGGAQMIQAQKIKDGRVNIMDVVRLIDGAQPDFIRSPDRLPALYSTARHPNGEAPRIMIASGLLIVRAALHEWRAAEFPAPHHQRVFQHAASF